MPLPSMEMEQGGPRSRLCCASLVTTRQVGDKSTGEAQEGRAAGGEQGRRREGGGDCRDRRLGTACGFLHPKPGQATPPPGPSTCAQGEASPLGGRQAREGLARAASGALRTHVLPEQATL